MIRILIDSLFFVCFIVALVGLVAIALVSMGIRLVWWLFTLPMRILEGRTWAR
jgi:hypothetical protein